MSWSFKFVAKDKTKAKAEVDTYAAQQHCLPASIAEMMKERIDAMPEPATNRALLVESNGHIDVPSVHYGLSNGEAKFSITIVGFLASLALFLFPTFAFAQAAGVIDDPSVILKALLEAVGKHNWPVVGVLALVAVVYVLRKFGGTFWPWLKTSEGGTVLAMLTAVGTALGGAAVAGVPITWSLVGTSLTAGFAAIGTWTGVRRLLRAVLPALTPVLNKVPKIGPLLVKLLTFASGAEVKTEVMKLTTVKFDAKTPASADDVAKDLDKPPSP